MLTTRPTSTYRENGMTADVSNLRHPKRASQPAAFALTQSLQKRAETKRSESVCEANSSASLRQDLWVIECCSSQHAPKASLNIDWDADLQLRATSVLPKMSVVTLQLGQCGTQVSVHLEITCQLFVGSTCDIQNNAHRLVKRSLSA